MNPESNGKTGLWAAVRESQALKLLIPSRPKEDAGWAWIGVDHSEDKQLLKQTVLAIKQASAGQPIKPAASMGIGTILAIIAGVFFLLMVIIPLTSYLFETLFR